MPIRPRAALAVAVFAAVFTCAAVAAPAHPAGTGHAAAHGSKHAAKAHARKTHAKGTAKAGHALTAKHAKMNRTSHKLHQAAAKHRA